MIAKKIDSDFKRVFETYDNELTLVEKELRDLFASNVFVIPLIGKYITDGGGKRIRPLFLVASAGLCGYAGQTHIPLAAVIESIHTASLLHDDVIDGADIRRGRTAAQGIWGNEVVVLVGDYLYSNALRKAVSCGNTQIVGALSNAVSSMTEGELLQLEKTGDPHITEDEYLKIISLKTGFLISTACRIGAILGGVSPEHQEALANFGMKAGTAFQIVDDLLDYMSGSGVFGKKLGKDLEEGKITLPLIYALENASGAERREMEALIEGGLSNGGLDAVRAMLEKHRAIERALAKAEHLLSEAKAGLEQFTPNPARQALMSLADYAMHRGH
ncbi:MAG: polyprenyl synthetase family protein [Actinomycetota bacterium]|nr:polyprenyl synthetase family protein [Actinomycetota bacterium]